MKKNKMSALVALSALVVVGLTACKKNDLQPDNNNPAAMEHNLKTLNPEAGFKSNDGYPTNYHTLRNYYRTVSVGTTGQQAQVNNAFGGTTTSTVFGYGAVANAGYEAYAYHDNVNNITYVNINGAQSGVLDASGNNFNLPIEEIEMYPSTTPLIYALVKNGSNMEIWQIDGVGTATPLTYGTGHTVFAHTATNGYKSGSITFVPNGSGSYNLEFSSESTVYLTSGLVIWNFSISGTTLTLNTAGDRTYTNVPTGTGHINTAYNVHDGLLYFNRDGATTTSYTQMYSVDPTSTSLTPTWNTPFTCDLNNDIAYWSNY